MVNDRERLDGGIRIAITSAGYSLGVQDVRVSEEGNPHAFIRGYNDSSPPPPGSTAALCRFCTYLGDVVQYQQNGALFITHLWKWHGSY